MLTFLVWMGIGSAILTTIYSRFIIQKLNLISKQTKGNMEYFLKVLKRHSS